MWSVLGVGSRSPRSMSGSEELRSRAPLGRTVSVALGDSTSDFTSNTFGGDFFVLIVV